MPITRDIDVKLQDNGATFHINYWKIYFESFPRFSDTTNKLPQSEAVTETIKFALRT